MTNTFDTANRLVTIQNPQSQIQNRYNGVNDRVGQTVALSTTNYALDVAGGLPEVIYTSEGNLYLHLPGVVMTENAEGEVRYLLGDGLGSMRQAVDDNAELAAYHEFDPYGNPVDNTGGEPYGFTGEWWESDVRLLHLRARWYLPETGTFLSVDPVESEPPYSYAGGNPINITDPTGLWRWRRASGIAPQFHEWAEDWYEGANGQNPFRHLEYTIPFFRKRPDMFNSVSGDVYEIEPVFAAQRAQFEATGYTVILSVSAWLGNLQGINRRNGQSYNWNNTNFRVGSGRDWPGTLRKPIPVAPNVTYVAAYVGPGTVLYWLEVPNPKAVPVPIRVHDKRIIKPYNYNPQLAWQPGYVVSNFVRACGQALVFVGGTIILVTVVEDIATLGLGTFDDAVTVPGGIWLINVGLRLAVFVPAAAGPAY